MLDGPAGAAPDPYIFYKLHHVERARQAWILSEELGLYGALREGPRTVAEICQRTGLQERPVQVLLWANAWLGIVGSQRGRHHIYPVMREFVLDGGRARVKPRVPDDDGYDIFRRALTTNQPQADFMSPWMLDPSARPGVTAFAPDRDGWRSMWGEALAEAFDFSLYRCVADLGGATGGLLVGLTSRYPGLMGILIELPYSVESARQAIEAAEAEDRVSVHTGDFFELPYPEGIDVCFMSHVIHDWDDEGCLKILRNCYETLPAGSPVIVQEYLLNQSKDGSLLAVFQAFGLVRGTPGMQRNAAEIAALMAEVGFTGTETRAIDQEQSIVIGWKQDHRHRSGSSGSGDSVHPPDCQARAASEPGAATSDLAPEPERAP